MDDLTTWADRLERAIRVRRIDIFDRVFVLSETTSTQDAAVRLATGNPGVIVAAGRQLAGRGRLGRQWRGNGSLTITFALDSGAYPVSHLALAGGLAAALTVDAFVPLPGFRAAIRWPNDVVEWPGAMPAGIAQPRKLSGILVEIVGELALVGVGINILQQADDWSEELQTSAVSLRQLGSEATRIDVAERLVVELVQALGASRDELCRQWSLRNSLEGRQAAFICDGKRYDGTVESLTPDFEIVVRASDGILHRLAAAHTSMVK